MPQSCDPHLEVFLSFVVYNWLLQVELPGAPTSAEPPKHQARTGEPWLPGTELPSPTRGCSTPNSVESKWGPFGVFLPLPMPDRLPLGKALKERWVGHSCQYLLRLGLTLSQKKSPSGFLGPMDQKE